MLVGDLPHDWQTTDVLPLIRMVAFAQLNIHPGNELGPIIGPRNPALNGEAGHFNGLSRYEVRKGRLGIPD